MTTNELRHVDLAPIPYTVMRLPLRDLRLGFKGKRISFSWRPYPDRTPKAREDFDRLIVSIYHHGILCPLITHRGHVLIGQRRAEIGQRLGIETVECWDVEEDVTKWWRPDVARLDQLKLKVGEVVY